MVPWPNESFVTMPLPFCFMLGAIAYILCRLLRKLYQALCTCKAELRNSNTSVIQGAVMPKSTFNQLGIQEGEDLVSLLHEIWPGVGSLTFCPTWWIYSGLLQTWYTSYTQFCQEPDIHYHREMVRMEDGGVVRLDWHNTPKWKVRQGRTVLIVPGLTSSSAEVYIRSIVLALSKAGWRTVVMNNRGCGNTPTLTSHAYSGAMTCDLRYIANYVQEKIGESQLVGLGFSLGANILVKYLGEEGYQTPMIAATSIGNPWDFIQVKRHLPKFLSKILAVGLKDIFREGLSKFFHDHPDISIQDVLASETVSDYDETMVRRHFGYSTLGDYYRDASSIAAVHKVRVPLLGVNAEDDPICHHTSLPLDEMAANPYTALIVTRRGGHLGWWESPSGANGPQQWINDVICQYVDAVSALVVRGKFQKPAQTEGVQCSTTLESGNSTEEVKHHTLPLDKKVDMPQNTRSRQEDEQCCLGSKENDAGSSVDHFPPDSNAGKSNQSISPVKCKYPSMVSPNQSKKIQKCKRDNFLYQGFQIIRNKYLSRWPGKLSALLLLAYTICSSSIQKRRFWAIVLLSGYSALLTEKKRESKR